MAKPLPITTGPKVCPICKTPAQLGFYTCGHTLCIEGWFLQRRLASVLTHRESSAFAARLAAVIEERQPALHTTTRSVP